MLLADIPPPPALPTGLAESPSIVFPILVGLLCVAAGAYFIWRAKKPR